MRTLLPILIALALLVPPALADDAKPRRRRRTRSPAPGTS